jgi:phosphopantetheinyl transferase (holo-ACP synthase)
LDCNIRFAAKEAIIKASPWPVKLSEITIVKHVSSRGKGAWYDLMGVVKDGRPVASSPSTHSHTGATTVTGESERGESNPSALDLSSYDQMYDAFKDLTTAEAERKLYESIEGQAVPIGISHDGLYAVATALFYVPPDGRDQTWGASKDR